MADERWADIFAAKRTLSLPGVPSPTYHDGPRACPRDCSGRHEVDGFLYCQKCGGKAYEVLAHEYPHQACHYWYSFVPLNGAPPWEGRTPSCCGAVMVRGWER